MLGIPCFPERLLQSGTAAGRRGKQVLKSITHTLREGFTAQPSPILAELPFVPQPFCACGLYLVVFTTMTGAEDRHVSGLGVGGLGCSG